MTNCINKRKGAWHLCVRIERYKITSAEEFSKEKLKQDPSLPTSLDLLQGQREALRNYFSMPFEEILHSDATRARAYFALGGIRVGKSLSISDNSLLVVPCPSLTIAVVNSGEHNLQEEEILNTIPEFSFGFH
jgi:hypothetical protein